MIKCFFTTILLKVFSLVILFFSTIEICFSQLQRVNTIPIVVNYTQTTHLIFPSIVKYYESVSDYVVCDSPPEAPNLVRIKANKKSFHGNSNVSVATEDGSFYMFEVRYQNNIEKTFYRFPSISSEEEKVTSIEVSDLAHTHIVFPSKIIYIDFGDDVVEASKAENTENVLRIQSKKKFDIKTNVSIKTEDGTFYTYNLVYKEKPETLLYKLKEDHHVILTDNSFPIREREDVIKRIKTQGRRIYNIGVKKRGMMLTVKNIALYKDALIFSISIGNKTNIPYDIDYIRYYITDKKVSKLTASQDEEKNPIFGLNHTTKHIEARGELDFIVAFEKFSLSNDKIFRLEINEKGGGRHIIFEIENEDIEECEQLM